MAYRCASSPPARVARDRCCRKRLCYPNQEPRYAASTASAPPRAHLWPTSPVGTRKSLDESTSPAPVLCAVSPLSGRYGPRPSVYLTASSLHLWVSLPGALEEESSSRKTSGSRVCRDCSSDQPRTPRLIARQHPLLPGWPSPACRLQLPHAENYKTVLLSSGAPPVAGWSLPQAGWCSPFAQIPLRTLIALTGCSAPVPRIGTLILVGPPRGFLP